MKHDHNPYNSEHCPNSSKLQDQSCIHTTVYMILIIVETNPFTCAVMLHVYIYIVHMIMI